MFLTIPDPADCFSDAGSFGGLVATGADDPGAIASFLMQDDHAGASCELARSLVMVPFIGMDWKEALPVGSSVAEFLDVLYEYRLYE